MAVRIEAPIPGKDIVGIEIPNASRKTVSFREVVESRGFRESKHKLPMALGHDIQGRPRVEDLARMPHLLVAGATGAGKSVCLNTIITSLLMRASPEEMQLLLLDPKRIEMASYSELPHLVHPVVTDMELAKTALDWAVHEMDRRYEAMAELSVRNIEGFNARVRERQKKNPEPDQEFKPLPYLVVIVDELADLMLTAGKEAEAHIVRLAQLARAAGIHLILATQRPSVDVVTGLIKANFPARIAFQVSSKHDSRTILDTVGAQYLLGQGDMLFKSGAGKLNRVHGAFISDQDISAIIDFWKHKQPRPSDLDLKEWKTEMHRDGNHADGDDVSQDPLYGDAVSIVRDQGKASISMIQRQMRIGFNRAARFIEQMERDGVIGPQEGSKPRTVMK
jgi:S-DNA-T family DNA segregation ATPase FtsK/SpoIIIE